jgi:uncharacterized protein involved in exopolysaccharide biosynthesis
LTKENAAFHEENQKLQDSIRQIQSDHAELLQSVNNEVDLLRRLEDKIDTFERERYSQSEDLGSLVQKFGVLEDAFESVRGKLAYLLNT